MTPLWTSADAVQATGGRATVPFVVTGVSIDSRDIAQGDMFVALTAARDGHDFVKDALAKGAAAALVTHVPDGVAEDAPLLIVKDVQEALEALGRAARARTDAKVIAVTGSVGKTGTKEMLRAMLMPQGRVHAAEKSFNNHWGVPLTLARMPADTDFAVLELGMNHPGEIAPLSKMARPDCALITTVAAVHAEAFASVRDIAREKVSIAAGLRRGGTIVLNRDDAVYGLMRRRVFGRGLHVVRFGSAGRPDFLMRRATPKAGQTSVEARIHRRPVFLKLAAQGRHFAINAMGALAAVEAIGADVTKAALALGQWRAPDGRGARWRVSLGDALDGDFLLIDDSYNANPTSMGAALEVLAQTEPFDGMGRIEQGRRIAVLGDMLELGPDEAKLHANLAQHPALTRVHKVHCCGPLMRHLHEALPHEKRGIWAKTAKGLAKKITSLADAGDVVLVKGSNGSGVARCVTALKQKGEAKPDQAGVIETKT